MGFWYESVPLLLVSSTGFYFTSTTENVWQNKQNFRWMLNLFIKNSVFPKSTGSWVVIWMLRTTKYIFDLPQKLKKLSSDYCLLFSLLLLQLSQINDFHFTTFYNKISVTMHCLILNWCIHSKFNAIQYLKDSCGLEKQAFMKNLLF